MTLADIAYFPFLERISATLKPYKVRVVDVDVHTGWVDVYTWAMG